MIWTHKMHCNSWVSVVLFNLPVRQQVNESVQDRLVGLGCRKGLWHWMYKAYRDPRGSILIQEHQDLAAWEESVLVYKLHICFSLLLFFSAKSSEGPKVNKTALKVIYSSTTLRNSWTANVTVAPVRLCRFVPAPSTQAAHARQSHCCAL